MQDNFDPDAFIAQMDAEESSQVPLAQDLSGFDPDAFISNMDRPVYANGFDFNAPINDSPLSVEDRAKLSVGNKAGQMKFLKERFADVKETKGGDLVVQDNGYWKRVDADGWTGTREALSDLVDIAPDVVKAATQIGAGVGAALSTGGTSLLAQGGIAAGVGAALEAGEISLGRLFGTYEATPEEMARDIAVEGLMNLGGTAVAAGVKPAASVIAKGLKEGINKVNNIMPVGARDSFINSFATLGGLNQKVAKTVFDNPDDVTSVMKEGFDKAGASGINSYLVQESIKDVKGIVKAAPYALSDGYKKMAKEVADTAGDDFFISIKNATSPVKDVLVSNGLADKIIDPKTNAVTYKFLNKQEIVKKFQENSGGSFGLQDDAIAEVSKLTELINRVDGVADLKGKAGAEKLLSLRKDIFDTTYELKARADEAGLNGVGALMAQVKGAFDTSITSKFTLPNKIKTSFSDELVDNPLIAMNSKYSSLLNELSPVLAAGRQATKAGSDAPYEALLGQLSSSAGKNEVRKAGFDGALRVLNQFGGSSASAANKMYKNIELREAARAIAPMTKIGLGTQAPVQLATGMAATGNIGNAAGVAASMIPTSPRFTGNIIKQAAKLNKFYRSMTPEQTAQYLSNPGAVLSTMDTILNIPAIQQQTATELLRQGTGGAF